MFRFDHRKTRAYTTALLDAVQDGVLDPIPLVQDLLGWMSEADVEEFVCANDLLVALGLEEDEE